MLAAVVLAVLVLAVLVLAVLAVVAEALDKIMFEPSALRVVIEAFQKSHIRCRSS